MPSAGAQIVGNDSDTVTPPSGPSLLGRLGTRVDLTALGRLGYHGSGSGAAAERARGGREAPPSTISAGFEVTGADLYRLNCRSCHGISAEGLQPLIPAVLDPVRAASPQAVQDRMEQRGRPISDTLARRLASRAELSIRHRLLEGGAVMPPFDHLDNQEIDALLAYLADIAGVELAGPQPGTLQVPAVHVGEQLIKATCQICHDAGPGQWRRAEDKVIPPLSEFTRKYAVSELVHKVRSGTVQVGETRGRMPIFEYLSEAELEAAYVYLIAYPPRQTDD